MRLFSKIRIFSQKSELFLSKIRIFYQKSDFFSRKSDFFRKHTKFGGCSFAIYYFSKTYKIRCLVTFRVSLLHRYLQYLTQCGVKPGLYSVRRTTQTELRKRIYADTRIMAFILLRRSRRVCTRIVGVFTRAGTNTPTDEYDTYRDTGWRIRYVSRIHFFSEAKLGNG